MKLNLKELLREKDIDPSEFVVDLEKGVLSSPFPPNIGYWRVSELVRLWDENSGGGKCQKILYFYLTKGRREDFPVETQKRFDVGHKIHDLVKEYFEKSPEFEVLHNEYSVMHPTLPLTGTVDHIVRWKGRKYVVEIKSVESTYFNAPIWGSRIKPFKKARWQAGIYSKILGLDPIVVYFNKDDGEIAAHFLKEEDYLKDVNEILEACRVVYNTHHIQRQLQKVS
jgi:hypothetical protein